MNCAHLSQVFPGDTLTGGSFIHNTRDTTQRVKLMTRTQWAGSLTHPNKMRPAR